MKKMLFTAFIAIFAITANAQFRTTEVSGSKDTSNNRTLTNGIRKSTDNISFVEQTNGNVVTLIALRNDRNKIQGWHVSMSDKNGKLLFERTYSRKKYQKAYDDAYSDYYGQSRRGSGLLNVLGNMYNRAQGRGVVNGSNITWYPNGRSGG